MVKQVVVEFDDFGLDVLYVVEVGMFSVEVVQCQQVVCGMCVGYGGFEVGVQCYYVFCYFEDKVFGWNVELFDYVGLDFQEFGLLCIVYEYGGVDVEEELVVGFVLMNEVVKVQQLCYLVGGELLVEFLLCGEEVQWWDFVFFVVVDVQQGFVVDCVMMGKVVDWLEVCFQCYFVESGVLGIIWLWVQGFKQWGEGVFGVGVYWWWQVYVCGCQFFFMGM